MQISRHDIGKTYGIRNGEKGKEVHKTESKRVNRPHMVYVIIVCLSVALERISLVLDFWTWAKVFYTEPAFDRANHIACIPCASVSVVSLALNDKVKNMKREHLFVPPINFILSLIYTGSPIVLIPYI